VALDLLTPRRLDYANPVNWEAPLNRGLVAWWQVLPQRMGGARWLDLTGYRPMALPGLGPSDATQGWGPTRRPGGLGELRLSGGAAARGELAPLTALNGASGVTIAGWAWQRVLDQIAYLWDTFLTGNPYWSFSTWSDGNIYLEVSPAGGTAWGAIDYSTVVAAQTWFHLAIVFDGSGAANADRLKLYVNGVPRTLSYSGVGAIPATWPAPPTAIVTFARSQGSGNSWDGKLDDWRIWRRALDPAEAQALYLRSRRGYPQELRRRSPLRATLDFDPAPPATPQGLTLLTPRILDYAHPVNWEAPLNRGLLAWWQVLPQRMGGRRLLDLTGVYPMTFAALGASSATQGWAPTRRVGGWGEVRLNDDGGTVQGSPGVLQPIHNAPAVTLAGWARQATIDVREYLWAAFDATTRWQVETWEDGFLYIELNATYGGFDYSTAISAGVWFHLAVVFDGAGATNPDRLKVYVNGQAQALSFGGTIPSAWPDVVGVPALLGRHPAGTFPWHGAVDDWRLWLRALPAPEVQTLVRRSRLRSPQELRRRSPLHTPQLAASQSTGDVVGAVPSGITVLWSGTAASIPSGWTRTTALDGLYPRGAAAAAEPGSTGGALTHTHTSTAHSHTTAHTHTVPASTTPTGATARDTGTTNPPAVHTHAATVTVNPATATATDTPSTDSGSQQPPYAEVLFLRSSGTTLGFPASMLALWNEAGGLPSGWELADGTSGKPDLRGRYLKGAAAAGDGGGSGGALTHSHTLASHTHSTPYAHTHPDVTSNQRTEALTTGDIGGATAGTATATHTHTLTIASATAAITGSTDGVSAVNHEPPYWVQAYIQNISGALSWPDKLIALWTGSLATIPANWKLCDGTSGTPDLRTYFVKGAMTLGDIGATGGSLTHTHTATGHTHALAGHTHSVTAGAGAGENRTAGATNAPTTAHTHTWPDATSTSLTSGSTAPTVTALGTTAPPYTTVVFVQWQAPGVHFAASLSGASATPSVARTLTRRLSTGLLGSSTTPAATATIPITRLLTAALAPASTTPPAARTLTRRLTGQLVSASTTPPAARTLTRRLTTTLAGASATPSVTTLTTVRHLTGALAPVSTTPAIARTLTRRLTTTLASASTTPSASVVLLTFRHLIATLSSASTTPASARTLTRRLNGGLVGASATPAIARTLTRRLQAALGGASTTFPAVGTLGVFRSLVAQLAPSSTTPASACTLVRRLLSAVLGASQTPPVTASMTAVRALTASLSTTSTTPASARTILRRLQAAGVGASITPAATALLLTLRRLEAVLSTASTTPAASARQTHRLTAQVALTSATPASASVQHHALTGTLLGSSATPSALLVQTLLVQAALAPAALTPPAQVLVQRHLAALVHGASLATTAESFVRHLQALLAGTSTTAAVTPSMVPPFPAEATGTLTRVEYPTEVHFFTPSGTLVKIVPKIRKPELRRYPRREPL
jgi:hypothetical protein